ncbi:MAG: hypothetical protein V4553_06230 [Bacteroidota bacterium]
MKPTKQEKQWLKDYLYQTMEYRETYEEVYDHILLALENEPRPEFFEGSVMKIITDDFGSNNALYELERSCKYTAERDSIQQYVSLMKLWVTPKLILFTGLIFCSLCSVEFKFPILLSMLFFQLSLVPFLLFLIRKVIIFFKRSYKKASLKDEISKEITYHVTRRIWAVLFVLSAIKQVFDYLFNQHQVTYNKPLHHKNLWSALTYHKPLPANMSLLSIGYIIICGVIIAGLITWIILHLITIVKLYQREFKSQMITN